MSFKKNNRNIVVLLISNKNNNKVKKPPIIEAFPDFYDSLIEFCSLNIGDSNADTVHWYINSCISIIGNNQQQFDTVITINKEQTATNTVPVDLRSKFQVIGNNLLSAFNPVDK